MNQLSEEQPQEPTIKTGGEDVSIFEIMQRYRNDGSCEYVIQDALRRLSLLDSDSQAATDAAGTRDEWKEFAEECKEGIRASHRVLDELGVPREDAWLQETDGKNYGIEEVVEYPVHARIKMLPPFIATAMRDKCVEKVKAMRDQHYRDYEYWRSIASDPDRDFGVLKFTAWAGEDERVIDALESLTLDQVKPGLTREK